MNSSVFSSKIKKALHFFKEEIALLLCFWCIILPKQISKTSQVPSFIKNLWQNESTNCSSSQGNLQEKRKIFQVFHELKSGSRNWNIKVNHIWQNLFLWHSFWFGQNENSLAYLYIYFYTKIFLRVFFVFLFLYLPTGYQKCWCVVHCNGLKEKLWRQNG